MPRQQVQGIEITEGIRPVANPVDTYVQAPQTNTDSSNLMDLARSLSKLDAPLGEFVAQRQARAAEEDKLRGEQAFLANNKVGYAEAVASGQVPSFASRHFVRAYKEAEGSNLGYTLEQKFQAAYAQWTGKDSEDPAAFNKFLGDFTRSNVTTNDPDVLRGLLPRIRALGEQALFRNIKDRDAATRSRAVRGYTAGVDNTIDTEDADGKKSDTGTDYDKMFRSIDDIRKKAAESGLRGEEIDNKIIDVVAAKAIELRDPKILAYLDRNVEGTNFSWKDTEYGRKVRAETITTLETMGRKALAEEEKAKKEAEKVAQADINRRTIEAIIANPNGPLPEELLKQGEKYDPEFRINVMKWRASVYNNAGQVDPEAISKLQWDIINGAGMPAIKRAMEMGILKNREDLMAAYRLVQDMEKHGKTVDGIMKGGSASTILSTIRQRTMAKDDATAIFSPDGMSDTGLSASFDFRSLVLEWASKNPNATLQEQEAAINVIGAEVLKRLGRLDDGMGAATYNRDGITAPNPFAAQPGRPQQPQVPQPQPQPQPQPAAPPAPASPPAPQPVQPQQPAPTAVPQEFMDQLRPETRARVEESARRMGIPPAEAYQQLFKNYQERNLRPRTMSAQEPADPMQQVSDAVVQVAQQVGLLPQPENAPAQVDEDAEPSAGVVKQVGDAIMAAFNDTGTKRKTGAYTLATIKDDPKAAKILDFISVHESAGNYNAVWGNANSKKDLSKLTLDQILEQQKETRRAGGQSAIGRYQFIYKTLKGLKKEMGLTGDEKFTPLLQDQLAVQLLRRRGYDRFKAGKMSLETFALELAKEWASLPDPNTGRSYYAGDGLNASGTSTKKFLNALKV